MKKYYEKIEICSNKDHAHFKEEEESERMIRPEIVDDEKVHRIVRPHESAKKRIDLLTASDFDQADVKGSSFR